MSVQAQTGGPRLIVDIDKRLASFHLRVQLAAGTEIMVLFGPSGAGKTTTLNAIAGLVTLDAGEISMDGCLLFRKHRLGGTLNVPARNRRIGYVFQHYALFPHLTTLENVAYPLWRRQNSRQPRRGGWLQAEVLLQRMRLEHLADRYPHEISGGQQQRVAIARALAADPQVLLLDEPFSALDAAMRERLQKDLYALHAELGLVVIYVTHRLEDAFALGHRLAVIGEGQVAQIGPIEDVFRRPVNYDVAEIMGIRNLFRARVVDATPERLVLDWHGLKLEAPPQSAEVGAAVTAYIRPEDIKVLYPDRPIMGAVYHNQVTGRILDSRYTSSFRMLRVLLLNGHEVEVVFPAYSYVPLRLMSGDDVLLSLRKEGLVILHSQAAGATVQPGQAVKSEVNYALQRP
jgi:molybdate transport system ATP-binding protein